MSFDLLTTVEYGGCSAKLSPAQLSEVLASLPTPRHEKLLVDISTHDDAGVWQLSEELALIQTVDFFPPVCSDPFEFGMIAAANALSDVYAMGGTPINALNIVMFPQSRIPLDVLRDILAGGMEKIAEAGAVVVGGHTIDDYPPKYGLAVTGIVHPRAIITNAAARPGECLILTKALGTGTIIAGHRIGEGREQGYRAALDSMKMLNRAGAQVISRYGVRCATDVTGFGLLGHALKMATASGVTIQMESKRIPLLEDAYRLVEMGCIPGASFRNQTFAQEHCRIDPALDYNLKMLLLDPQTSGGLLFTADESRAEAIVDELQTVGCPAASVIGRIEPHGADPVVVD